MAQKKLIFERKHIDRSFVKKQENTVSGTKIMIMMTYDFSIKNCYCLMNNPYDLYQYIAATKHCLDVPIASLNQYAKKCIKRRQRELIIWG